VNLGLTEKESKWERKTDSEQGWADWTPVSWRSGLFS